MSQFISIICSGMETAFNGLLRHDPDTRTVLAGMAGRSFAVEISGTGQTIYILPFTEGLRFTVIGPDSPDVIIRGHATALLGMLRPRGQSGNSAGQVEIKGDIHLAQALQSALRGMSIDWDEFVAGYLGDMAAHRIGRLRRGVQAYFEESLQSLGVGISEYLRYEARWLPARVEVDTFLEDVDRIRDDVERAQQRLALIETRAGDKP